MKPFDVFLPKPITIRHVLTEYFESVLWNNEKGPILVMIFSDSSCPSSHKYVYADGKYCCQTNKENNNGNGDLCDGSEIGIDSTCCENHKFIKCAYDRCNNHKDIFTNGQGNVK